MRRWLPFVLLLFLTLGSVGLRFTAPESTPVLREEMSTLVVEPEAAPRDIEELRARIAEVLAKSGVPGVGIALVDRDGPIWIGGVGQREIGGAAVDGDTVFRIASITKSFIALGVMKLAEEGRLDLDRPFAEYLPDVAIDNAWHDVAPVTVAHALEHTAGFDDMRFNETFTTDETMSVERALAINPRSRIVRWRPGSRFAYSNVGYTVAARAIEVATGEPFDTWLRREVLQPLGMRDADFQRTPALASRLATGYREGEATRFVPIAHRPAGALLTSPRELAGLVHFWLRRGDGFPQLVSRRGLERIERTGTQPYPSRDVGYGLGNYGDVGHPVRARGHDGGLPGFSSCMRYFPELGVGYVVLLGANSGNAMVAIRRLVFAYLARDRELPPLPDVPRDALPTLDADAYAYANPRHELFGFLDRALGGWRIEVEPGKASVEALVGGARAELVATPDGGYRLARESGTSMRLARDADGAPVLLAHGAYGEPTTWWIAKTRVWLLGAAMLILQVARVFSLGVVFLASLRRREVAARSLVHWPVIAAIALDLLPLFLAMAGSRALLGEVHGLTITICATTIVFALASGASFAAMVRWSARKDRPPLWYRLVPSLAACAAFGLTMWLGAHGIIGLRTWAW